MQAASFEIAVMMSGQNTVLGVSVRIMVPALIENARKNVGTYKLRVHSKVDRLNTNMSTITARRMVTMEKVK